MPGKKAPDYFPLNLNMSGMGKGSYYGDVSPVLSYHGKFDNSGLGMICGSPINTLTNNSPNTNAFSLSEYITINGVPPVNSEDEDDNISHSGSESVSIQDSDDLDIDDVDSLTFDIREKLQMAPTSVNECPLTFTNSCSMSASSSSDNLTSCSGSSSRRRRNHPYSHLRSSINFSQYHHRKQQSSNSSNSSSPGGTNASSSSAGGGVNNKGHNSYYRRFHKNQQRGIGKNKSSHQKNWWATSVAKGCGSSSSITKQFSRTDDPYQLLQELLEKGDLIKEAVRRLNRKCLNSSNGSNTITNPIPPTGTAPTNSISASVICSSTNDSSYSAPASSTINNASTRFSFIVGEDTENSYPVIPIANQ